MEYCQKMAENSVFTISVCFTPLSRKPNGTRTARWTVSTDRGDAMKAKFVVLANGILTTPKLARIDGMSSFKGDSFHTSRWDYNMTLRASVWALLVRRYRRTSRS